MKNEWNADGMVQKTKKLRTMALAGAHIFLIACVQLQTFLMAHM
jgi:hypothetical protein